jgi:hypothetical protein
MDPVVKERVLASKAREYVMMHSSLKYSEIEAHAAKEYATEADRKAFVDAVLHANVVIENEHAKSRRQGL